MGERLDLAGIGSIVLDRIYRADAILGPDSKGLVRDCTEVVGGVTLNHVSWARSLGLRTGVFGRQGDDSPGRRIRAYLDAMGIDRSHLRTDGEGSSTANIYVDAAGERCIYMDRAATETTTAEHIDVYFADYIRSARTVSTEISQLPLAATVRVLEIAADAGVPAALDIDIPLSQAVDEAGLGTRAEAERALALATILKPARSAVREMFPARTATDLAPALFERYAAYGRLELVALTDGAAGCVLTNGAECASVSACTDVTVRDTTGAGDAFFGGLLAGIHHGLALEPLGQLANACGAACVEQIGATPRPSAGAGRVLELYGGPTLPGSAADTVPGTGAESEAVRECVRILCEEFDRWGGSCDTRAIARAADCIDRCVNRQGRVHVTGVGKPEHIARYTASLLSSTGTPAHFLHATECVHGSAGQVRAGDVVIGISNSGATPELLAAAEIVTGNGATVLAVTSDPDSPLARMAAVTLIARAQREGGPLGLAPRASILAALASVMALSVALQDRRGLTREQYAQWHPGGALGRTARER